MVAAPAAFAAATVGCWPPERSMNRFEKSTLPSNTPIGGITISLTSDVTIFPNAAPITIPTARSSTLPRMMNSLNSLNMAVPPETLIIASTGSGDTLGN